MIFASHLKGLCICRRFLYPEVTKKNHLLEILFLHWKAGGGGRHIPPNTLRFNFHVCWFVVCLFLDVSKIIIIYFPTYHLGAIQFDQTRTCHKPTPDDFDKGGKRSTRRKPSNLVEIASYLIQGGRPLHPIRVYHEVFPGGHPSTRASRRLSTHIETRVSNRPKPYSYLATSGLFLSFRQKPPHANFNLIWKQRTIRAQMCLWL